MSPVDMSPSRRGDGPTALDRRVSAVPLRDISRRSTPRPDAHAPAGREHEPLDRAPHAPLVFTVIWLHTDDAGWAFPSQVKIAAMAGTVERSVRNSVDRLFDAGLLAILLRRRVDDPTFQYRGKPWPRGQALYLVWELAPPSARDSAIDVSQHLGRPFVPPATHH